MQNIYTESCPLWDRGPSRYSEYPACTQTVLSDKMIENTKEKGRREHMSFVGLTFFKDHIIGFMGIRKVLGLLVEHFKMIKRGKEFPRYLKQEIILFVHMILTHLKLLEKIQKKYSLKTG